jgi:hypothetical protein
MNIDSSRERDFLTQLQAQARKQALLEQRRFIPKQLDHLTSFFGRYPWQVLFVASVASVVVKWMMGAYD